jgi:hypothetical protein
MLALLSSFWDEARLFIIGAVVAGIIGAGFYYHHKWYDEGAAAVKALDAKALAAQIAKDNLAINAAEHANDTEIAALQNYIASVPVPTVRLCINPNSGSPVPSPSKPHPSAAPAVVQPVPPGNSAVRADVGPDISNLLSLLAERADELSAELREYQVVVK